MATRKDIILRNQSGTALVIALIMMVALTLIALASSYTSIFEIKLSGNQRGSTDAFYAADAGVNVVTPNIENFNLNRYAYNAGTNTYRYNPFTDITNPNPNLTNATPPTPPITYFPTQSGPPRGIGYSAININYAYYLIEINGYDSLSSGSTTTIQEDIMRLLPLPQ